MGSFGVGGFSSMEQNSGGSKYSKGFKGKVYMHRLAVKRGKGLKTDVTFNVYGKPVGKMRAEFESFLGVLARRYISVKFELWKQVPEEAKEVLWDCMKLNFNIDDT